MNTGDGLIVLSSTAIVGIEMMCCGAPKNVVIQCTKLYLTCDDVLQVKGSFNYVTVIPCHCSTEEYVSCHTVSSGREERIGQGTE